MATVKFLKISSGITQQTPTTDDAQIAALGLGKAPGVSGTLTCLPGSGVEGVVIRDSTDTNLRVSLGESGRVSVAGSTATDLSFRTWVDGDPLSRLTIDRNGLMSWGTGAVALDVILQRSAAGALTLGTAAIPGVLRVVPSTGLNGVQVLDSTGALSRIKLIEYGGVQVFASSGTDAAFMAAVDGDTVNRFVVDHNGAVYWGPGGASTFDTVLNHGGVDTLAVHPYTTGDTFFIVRGTGTGNASRWLGESQRGTEALPTAVLSGDEITRFEGRGYDGTTFAYTGSYIRLVATENFSNPSNHGAKFEIAVTTNASATPTKRLTIEQDGTVRVGTDTVGVGKLGVGTGTESFGSSIEAVADGALCQIRARTYGVSGDSFKPAFIGAAAGGSAASPAAVVSGDRLAFFGGQGHDGSAYTGVVGSIHVAAAQTFTASAQGTDLFVATTPLGSTINTTRWVFKNDATFRATSGSGTSYYGNIISETSGIQHGFMVLQTNAGFSNPFTVSTADNFSGGTLDADFSAGLFNWTAAAGGASLIGVSNGSTTAPGVAIEGNVGTESTSTGAVRVNTATQSGGARTSLAASSLVFQVLNNGTNALRINGGSSVIAGTAAALATTATDGFLYIPTCAGAPTGTPTSYTGKNAMVHDTTNNRLYIYNGAWRSVLLA